MKRRGRKPKVYLEDFKAQQKLLLKKHADGECLTQEECAFLVGKDGQMPTCREEMVTKMTICKWEAAALTKMKQAICASYPQWTEAQVKEAMLDVMNHNNYNFARETGSELSRAGIL